ncbi:hypothetical protein BC829DRAFT_395409 [Chytridium lagenaria]|nr:hypothetical protein BC829DRAFT_395409 [Chytridium lagenaria]
MWVFDSATVPRSRMKDLEWARIGPHYLGAYLKMCTEISCRSLGSLWRSELDWCGVVKSWRKFVRDAWIFGMSKGLPLLLVSIEMVGEFHTLMAEGMIITDEAEECLKTACAVGNIKIMYMLLNDRRLNLNPSLHENVAFINATTNGHLHVSQSLLAHPRFDYFAGEACALEQAVKRGCLESIRLLLADSRSDPQRSSRRIFEMAVSTGQIELVKLLLYDERFDPFISENYFAIVAAAQGGHARLLEMLILDGRLQNSRGTDAALIAACELGHEEAVKTIVAHVSDLDPSKHRNLALARCTSVPCAEVLISHQRFRPECSIQALTGSFKSSVIAVKVLQKILMSSDDTLRVSEKMSDMPINGWISYILRNSPQESHALDLIRTLLRDSRVDLMGEKSQVLILASERNYQEILSLILSQPGVDPFGDSNLGLRLACKGGLTDIAATLLKRPDADPAVLNHEALRLASRHGRLEVVSLLLKDGRTDPKACQNEAILNACRSGNSPTVLALLADPRVDPSCRDNKAIREASRRGMSEAVKALLQHPMVNPSAYDQEALRNACTSGSSETVRLLLSDPRVDPSIRQNEAIRRAATSGMGEAVRFLLAHPKVDPAACEHEAFGNACGWVSPAISSDGAVNHEKIIYDGDSRIEEAFAVLIADPRALGIACARGRDNGFAALHALLNDPRVDPSACDNQAIRRAASHGLTDIVERLLKDPRVDPTSNDNQAIRKACGHRHVGVVRLLLADPRVDPSARDNEAVRKASSEFGDTLKNVDLDDEELANVRILEMLLVHPQVNPAARNHEVLFAALFWRRLRVVRLLLKDARVNPSFDNNRALRDAVRGGDLAVVKMLLKHPRLDLFIGERVDVVAAACDAGHLDVLKEILANVTLDPTMNDNEALCKCLERRQIHLVRALLSSPRMSLRVAEYRAVLVACEMGYLEGLKAMVDSALVVGDADALSVMQKWGHGGIV